MNKIFAGVDWKLYFHGRVFYEANCNEGKLYNVDFLKFVSSDDLEAFTPGCLWLLFTILKYDMANPSVISFLQNVTLLSKIRISGKHSRSQ